MSDLIKQKQPMSGWIMLIFWWAMILVALYSSTHMVGAGDTWVAMACGRHFINHGVDTVEPFSANSHKPGPTAADIEKWPSWAQKITKTVGLDTVQKWHPTGWVNQNWLTHVFFYWLTHLSPVADAETFDKPIVEQNFTYNTLVYWKYALYIATIIVVYYTGRALGANQALSAIFACFALFIGRSFFDIRPAGFSNMLTAVLLFIFVLAVYKNYLYIWLIVPVTVLWCNLHGGYVYIFIVLVPFIGLHLLAILPKRISMTLYYTLGWLLFFALAVKFLSHKTIIENINPKILPAAINKDALFWFIIAFIVGNVVLAFLKNIKPAILYIYQIVISLVVFIAVVGRFFIPGIDAITDYNQLFKDYVNDGRQTFFVAFIGFIAVAILLSTFRQRLQTISTKAWLHTVAAAIVAFFAMIIFNPFHITNLTHTFEVSVSEHAKLWKTVNEWHPAFEWDNPVGDEIPFLIMYILTWLLLAIWVFTLLLKPKVVVKKAKPVQAEMQDSGPIQYEWPKIDLPLMVIAAITIYMAIGSRRFIPVAAIAACPILAMFLDSSIRMIVATINLRRTGKAVMSQFPIELQRAFAAAALAVVIFLTCWWGYYYKAIYLDPWPDSGYLSSVFMRMSASYAKPFKACQFVRDNNMKGKVFNYWTEGGFVAYGQFPDPNTGKTPLQLFMDGRAQAAYNTDAYQRWMYIMSGGDPVREAERAGRQLTTSDYQKIGEWTDTELTKENTWVVFMPAAQFDSVLIKGLSTNPAWRPAYMDDEQEIYVNVKTVQGRELYAGVFTGTTKFPDEFSKLLTTGYNILRLQDGDPNIAFDMLSKALSIKPSNTAAIELIRIGQGNPEFRSKLANVFTNYFEDYLNKKQDYKKLDGYRDRLMATMIVGNYLSNTDPNFRQNYEQNIEPEFSRELERISKTSRW
ncbi:MAG: hypothetical protein A2Y12_08695 [Planctomycetes bacterium GWF2_42_9]|nr:MAG: hypothetical protein A2Y12_08695 [Planctomycetes bacterium GWF2_42_9]